LTALNRLCRELVSAICATEHPDILDDATVDRVLQDISTHGDAGRAAQMLGAMIVFAYHRLTTAQMVIGVPAMTDDDLEKLAASETGIDPALVTDCLAIAREMARPSRRTAILGRRIHHAITIWGPYALACEALIYVKIAARAAADGGIPVNHLVQSWAMSDELLLSASASPPPDERQRRND
jgi:hypothetical protein